MSDIIIPWIELCLAQTSRQRISVKMRWLLSMNVWKRRLHTVEARQTAVDWGWSSYRPRYPNPNTNPLWPSFSIPGELWSRPINVRKIKLRGQVSVAEWLARLTAVWEDPGSNHAAGSCVYRVSCCDIQSWAWAVRLYWVLRSTQPFTLRGTVKCVSAYGLGNNNSGDGG